MSKNDLTLKILLLGMSHSGKSCFVNRFVGGIFQVSYISTIGIDERYKKMKDENGNEINLRISDTAGQERFIQILKSSYKGAHGFILIYEITNKISFQFLKNLIKTVKGEAQNNAPIALVGNKVDCEDRREVTKEEGKKLAEEYNLHFFECSAKEGTNINEVFDVLVKEIMKNYKETGKKLVKEKTKNKKNKCS